MIRPVLCSLLLFSFFISKSQTATELSDMAQKKLEMKDYQYALVLIEKAIAKNDTNQWYYLTKAEIEFKLYGSKQALKSVFKAISINRKSPEPYSRAGSYYSSRNITDSAIYMYDHAIKYAPDDSSKNNYLLNRGSAKESVRDFEGARADYEKVLQFNPNDIAALNNIAGVYSELGMQRKGITYLKKIISLDPTFIGPYVNLGFIYSEMDSLDLALNYFNKALAIDAKEALVYNNRGYVYYKKGNYASALKDINYSIELYKSNSYAYRNLALVYIATKKKTETCDALRYAESYGFKDNYGDEVDELIKKHCK
jgi:tetratricopeptide (TPR) repeat protein